jgi:glucose-6-phosphate isomerase
MQIEIDERIQNELGNYAETLSSYLNELRNSAEEGSYTRGENSLFLPRDQEYQAAIRTAAEGLGNLRYLFVVGIGGSNLASKAFFDASHGAEANADLYHPQVLWLDAVSGRTLDLVESLLSDEALVAEDIAAVISSKSGTTTETVFNAEVLLASLYARFGDRARRRVIFACDPASPLLASAAAHGARTAVIPAAVGGRYSAFSSANLISARLAGIPVEDVLLGARSALDECLTESNNPALSWAAAIDLAYREGKRVHDLFVFAPELEALGKWYRQLFAESLGKRHDTQGREVRAGMLPTVSIGSTDLHSMAQLYFGGPQNTVTTFVAIEDSPDVAMPAERSFPDVVPDLAGKSDGAVGNAIREGTFAAYHEAEMPHIHVNLASNSPEEIGSFMQCAMVSVMLLAKLWDVNAFDQPEVERYKSYTRTLLGS